MESHEQRVPILEFLFRKHGANIPEVSEFPGILEKQVQDVRNDHEHSQIQQMYEQMAALQAQNEELKAYACTVAHDLKDPLYGMLLTSSLVTNNPGLSHAELKNYLQQITAAALQMNTIISNLLLFAKVSNTEALVERVDMDQVVANVLDRLSCIVQEHHAQIDIPESWPVAIGYAPWIEEVWANYLSNAIKHGRPSPHIELGASLQPDGMIRYWMRDNGPGLSVHDQARLFTPFSPIDHTCKSGNGVGLSIVLRIVEKLGGQAGCESELGQGSLFFFTLPAVSV